eukprot:15457219-Alexandrium_andersonii.AAC.1
MRPQPRRHRPAHVALGARAVGGLLAGRPTLPLPVGRHLAARGHAGVRGPPVGRGRLPAAARHREGARRARQ